MQRSSSVEIRIVLDDVAYNTRIRVHDFKSLDAVRRAARAQCFGRIGVDRIQARLTYGLDESRDYFAPVFRKEAGSSESWVAHDYIYDLLMGKLALIEAAGLAVYGDLATLRRVVG